MLDNNKLYNFEKLILCYNFDNRIIHAMPDTTFIKTIISFLLHLLKLIIFI